MQKKSTTTRLRWQHQVSSGAGTLDVAPQRLQPLLFPELPLQVVTLANAAVDVHLHVPVKHEQRQIALTPHLTKPRSDTAELFVEVAVTILSKRKENER